MDPAPRRFEDLPRDPEHDLPVPFACGTGDGGRAPSATSLDQRRVVQCALSRVCGVCGASLSRPITLFGSPEEADRADFHFPPGHLSCVQALLAAYDAAHQRVPHPLFGQDHPVVSWMLVTTAGVEFVRAGREKTDRRPTFRPNSVLEQRPA
ncbi:MAG: hypothetical protein ACRDPH_04580 [Marmoricola sp.]